MPRRSPRLRTCTGHTSRSAARAQPSPRKKGLEPLADAIFAQDRNGKAPEELAKDFLNPDLGVETIEDALSGASDIIAERISDDAELRKSLRARMQKKRPVRE